MQLTEVIMGMPITVAVPPQRGIEPGAEVFRTVFGFFREVDARFSPYKAESEVSRIRRGEQTMGRSSPLLQEIVRLCNETKVQTDGYFDAQNGENFDPSGLVKGWSIHEASRILGDLGWPDHCVEAGGDIEVRGRNKDGERWEIGIRNPFDPDTIVKVLRLTNRGVATSGTYIRGNHIYNPKTGESVAGAPSLTVVAENVYEADRLVTAAYAMGDQGLSFLMEQEGIEVFQIGPDHVALFSSGFQEYL